MKKSSLVGLLVAAVVACAMHVILDAQGQVGPNIDVISGVGDPYTGDPFRQRHNEAVLAISGVNPDHMMVAYNDYSTVDYANDAGVGTPSPAQGFVAKLLNLFQSPWKRERERKGEDEEEIAAAQAWMGWSFSDNGGKTWSKGLHYGHPFDNSGLAPELHGYQAVSDPVIASTHDKFFLGGIAFTPNALSAGFVSVLTDHNNTETGRNTGYDYTRVLVTSDATHFVDKPSIAALGNHVYAAYVLFDEADPTKLSSKILFFRSTDRGNTWSNPGLVVSQPLTRNQAPWILVDPNNENTVYIGWRVFSAVTGGLANAIIGRKSTNGGASFTPSVPWPVALLLKAFDQPQGQLNLSANPVGLPVPRSNAYPTAAIDGNGAIHVALQEWVNPTTGVPLGAFALTSTGVPRITVTSSSDGGTFWTPRKAIDFGPNSGTQFMPVMTAVGEPGLSCNGVGPRSRVMVMYYDARASTKKGYVTGGNKQFDVQIAEASACIKDSLGRLVFGASQPMSKYMLDPTAPGQIVKNAGYGYTSVNRAYEMFGGGGKSFTGDYIHLIPRVPYVNTPTGWKTTVANGVERDKLPAPVVQGVWADTRVAVLPTTPPTGLLPNDALFIDSLPWWNYQAPGTGKLPTACNNAGSRSQDVFTADYTPSGLFAAAPVTFRTSNIPRAYPLYVENRAAVQRFFRLTIDSTAFASFNYRSFAANPVAIDRTADVAIGPYSTVTGSVIVGPGVVSPVSITIVQISGIGGSPSGGAKTAVTLNTAGAAPFTQTESHDPVVQQTPTVSHPFAGLNVLPRSAGPTNPLPSPYTDNPYTDNPYTDNPYTDNVTVYDVIDTSITVKNGGDSAGAFSALLNVQNRQALQVNYLFQTFIHRISRNPGLNGCQTIEQRQDIQISTIKAPFTDNPYTDNPYTDNPYTDNPYTDNAQPDARASNSTFYLGPTVVPGQNDSGAATRPGDEVVYVLRASQIAANPPVAATFNPTAQVSLTVVPSTPDVVPLEGGGFGFDPGGPTVASGGAAVPVKLVFVQQPSSIAPGQPFTVQVAIQDAFGHTITNATQAVMIALGNNPAGGTLSGDKGPKNAVAGIATFSNLSIDNVGDGYTLVATSHNLSPATSAPISVFPPLTITTLALPDGTQFQPYSQTVFASGGSKPYHWDIKTITGHPEFSLPTGLVLTTLGDSSATITGVPSLVEVHSFRLRVTDAAGHSATQDLCIHIDESTLGNLDATPATADPLGAPTATTLQQIVQTLVGDGVSVSNVSYTGVGGAVGTFTGAFSATGLPSGIILSSGAVTKIEGTNTSAATTTFNNAAGDADLNALVTGTTQDAAVLEFDFTVTNANATVVKFDYVFASEEYSEFANTTFNDVFAFFLSQPPSPKQNLALIPGLETLTPVSINNVNNGNSAGGDATPHNPQFFVDNEPRTLPTQADGLTKVLSLQSPVTPGLTYHLKIAIADVGDAAYDSWVLLKAHSLTVVCPIIPNCPSCGQN